MTLPAAAPERLPEHPRQIDVHFYARETELRDFDAKLGLSQDECDSRQALCASTCVQPDRDDAHAGVRLVRPDPPNCLRAAVRKHLGDVVRTRYPRCRRPALPKFHRHFPKTDRGPHP